MTDYVQFKRDGLDQSPTETAELLARLTAERPVEGDVYLEGGAVQELEQGFAAELGKQAALFMPTGTLANQLAVAVLAQGRGRVVAQAESHLYRDSGDSLPSHHGLNVVPLAPGGVNFSLEELRSEWERNRVEKVAAPIRVVSVESAVRRFSNRLFESDELARIVAFAQQKGIALHLECLLYTSPSPRD